MRLCCFCLEPDTIASLLSSGLGFQVQRAVTALREYVAEQKKTNLVSAMDDVENFQLQFTFKKIPPGEQIIRV